MTGEHAVMPAMATGIRLYRSDSVGGGVLVRVLVLSTRTRLNQEPSVCGSEDRIMHH